MDVEVNLILRLPSFVFNHSLDPSSFHCNSFFGSLTFIPYDLDFFHTTKWLLPTWKSIHRTNVQPGIKPDIIHQLLYHRSAKRTRQVGNPETGRLKSLKSKGKKTKEKMNGRLSIIISPMTRNYQFHPCPLRAPEVHHLPIVPISPNTRILLSGKSRESAGLHGYPVSAPRQLPSQQVHTAQVQPK